LDPFESVGKWWLPEFPSTRVTGTLTYSDEDGFHLEIPLGFLGEMAHFINCNQIRRESIIHGILSSGKTVTLVDATRTNMTLNSPGATREEYKSSLGFVGNIESIANPQIAQLQVTYSHLRDWAVNHSFEWSLHQENDEFKGVDYHYEMPAATNLAKGDSWQIRLSDFANFTQPSVQGFHLNRDCKLILELDQPLTLNEVENLFLSPLWLFLSFCLDRSIYTQNGYRLSFWKNGCNL
jgi:hypothetical protein